MRLDLLPGSAKGCPGSTCISLCGWKGVILSLSLYEARASRLVLCTKRSGIHWHYHTDVVWLYFRLTPSLVDS